MTTVAASAIDLDQTDTAPPTQAWKSVNDPVMIATASSGTPALERNVVSAVTTFAKRN